MNKKTGLKQKVKSYPDTPGVYLMKSKSGKIIYAGKAISLRKRLASYFLSNKSSKTDALMEHVVSIECINCATEAQALILEASLIKEKKPKYNVTLRDDKSFSLAVISDDAFARVFVARTRDYDKRPRFIGVTTIGPYANAKVLRSVLTLIRKVFPYRSCVKFPKKVCLYYHLGLCPAPCEGKIAVFLYKQNIRAIKRILKGERKELLKDLESNMKKFAASKHFEQAAAIRDKINNLNNLYEGKNESHYLIALKDILGLKTLPLTISAIDISCLSGSQATGSIVVFKAGEPDKTQYRRFRIKNVQSQDDYAMIAEVLTRRYSKLREKELIFPDLIVIDGGLGQVNRAQEELDKLGQKTPVIGLAKTNEEVWFPFKAKPLIIPKNDPALHLLQRIRDEAHRFARKYHLLLRQKKAWR